MTPLIPASRDKFREIRTFLNLYTSKSNIESHPPLGSQLSIRFSSLLNRMENLKIKIPHFPSELNLSFAEKKHLFSSAYKTNYSFWLACLYSFTNSSLKTLHIVKGRSLKPWQDCPTIYILDKYLY